MLRDQFETLAPILTLGAAVFIGVAIYFAATGDSGRAWGALVVAGICAAQALIGWRQRRRRGDDKWAPM